MSEVGSIMGSEDTTVTVECDEGYSGGGTWTCTNRTFSGPQCLKVCDATQVLNSNMSDEGSITGVEGDTVMVTCNTGFIGGETWTCMEDGTFRGTPCTSDPSRDVGTTQGDCVLPDKAPQGFTFTKNAVIDGGTINGISCAPGYSGNLSATCSSDGVYSFTGCTVDITNCDDFTCSGESTKKKMEIAVVKYAHSKIVVKQHHLHHHHQNQQELTVW